VVRRRAGCFRGAVVSGFESHLEALAAARARIRDTSISQEPLPPAVSAGLQAAVTSGLEGDSSLCLAAVSAGWLAPSMPLLQRRGDLSICNPLLQERSVPDHEKATGGNRHARGWARLFLVALSAAPLSERIALRADRSQSGSSLRADRITDRIALRSDLRSDLRSHRSQSGSALRSESALRADRSQSGPLTIELGFQNWPMVVRG